MKQLNYQTLQDLNYDGYLLKDAPERILQFGEGNFMRAFVDFFIDKMNETADFNSKVVLVQPIPKFTTPDVGDFINEQEGLYTLYLRGSENGQEVSSKRVISCVSRCLNAYSDYEAVMECAKNPELRFITCNTTEAGIVYDPSCQFTDTPANSFPAKLTQFLYKRFEAFPGDVKKGFIILSCELIDNNGKELEKCVLKHAEDWNLGADFISWIKEANLFCSTLVDRIVTGYPRSDADALNQENGYIDKVLNTGEIFGFWVIEGPQSIKEEFPCEKANLPILVTDDHKPYKQRKVRILNGAHTSMVLGAYLAGQDIVRDCMKDDVIRGYMNQAIYQEIIPTLSLPEEELMSFAASVTDRFQNPFIDHALLSISLNSTAKWKARVLPSLEGYLEKTGQVPPCLSASLAFYLAFYKGIGFVDGAFMGDRNGKNQYPISDDPKVLAFYDAHKKDSATDYVHTVLSETSFWGKDLTALTGLEETVLHNFAVIQEKGCYELMKQLVNTSR